MGVLDWTIIAVYMAGVIAMSAVVGRGQEDAEDYYVGGRSLPWWAIGISTMATQTSVISFMSIPAFVALKEGGGLTWLQYELAVPLAMIAVMVLLLPFFRKLELISVYEYLELRFSPAVRRLMSAVFLVSRGLMTGVNVFTTALLLQVCTGLDFWLIVLFVGAITIVYDAIGGMKAVVWSDVVQMVMLLGGIVVCIVYAVGVAGGSEAVLDAMPAERWRALDFSAGFSGEGSSFWAFLLGGFFLYASYYGADQSQTQRELSAPTLADTKKALVLNGLCRFPLTCLYLVLGVALAGAYASSPALRDAVGGQPDALVPSFVVGALPAGVRALIVAAMLAAAMSSLDSALNSLSASTMRDFLDRDGRMPRDKVLLYSKVTTVVWGVAITGFAFVVGGIADTVLEAINKIGSAFYGPILAAFVVGVASRRASARGVLAGVLAGVALNLGLWIFAPDVSFWWWNLFGFVATTAIALAEASVGTRPSAEVVARYTLSGAGMLTGERRWLPVYAVLAVTFVIILATGLFLNGLA